MQTLLRSATLTTTHLQFTARARTPLELDMYSGASLRGSFFHAILTRFCMNKSAPVCASCPLHDTCPVSAIVAPLREDNSWGQDIPRPYIITPPLDGSRRYEPGESFSFGMTLFGQVINLLPYIMLSLPQFETEGLGHKLDVNGWQRGQFQVSQVATYHPFSGESVTIYKEGDALVQTPAITVTPEACLQRAEQFSPEKVTLNLVTPMRLIDREHLVKTASFRPIVQRLLERYLALERYYGNSQLSFTREEKEALLHEANAVICTEDRTSWQELKSYSNRQKRATPIGGLIGSATFTGNLAPFLPLLAMGELIHVGKNVVKGSGWYSLA